MKYEIILTEKAIADIDEIASYILQTSASLDTTRNFINRIYDSIERLSSFPNAGSNPRNHALLTEGYKFIMCEQYLIFYRISDATVYIAAVFNSKKDYFRYYTF